MLGYNGEDIYGIKGHRIIMVGIRDRKNYTPEHFSLWDRLYHSTEISEARRGIRWGEHDMGKEVQ